MLRPVIRIIAVLLNRFATSTAGAVTVDYVVLTAAVTAMGLGAIASIRGGTETMSAQIESDMNGSGNWMSGGGSGAPTSNWPVGGSNSTPPNSNVGPDYPEPPPQTEGPGTDTPPTDPDNQPTTPPSAEGGTDPDGGSDPDTSGDTVDTPPNTPNPGQGSGDAQPGTDPAPDVVDFLFEDLSIGCYWSDRSVSHWLTLNLPQDTPFRVYGDGNPLAQGAENQRGNSGNVRWGTNIEVDIPQPGSSRTVFMEIGDRVGSFTVHRAACN